MFSLPVFYQPTAFMTVLVPSFVVPPIQYYQDVITDPVSDPESDSLSESADNKDEKDIRMLKYNGTCYFAKNVPLLAFCHAPEKLSHSALNKLLMATNFRLTTEELRENGYPLYGNGGPLVAHIKPTQFDKNRKMFAKEDDLQRKCVRCNEVVSKDGKRANGQPCRYHLGKPLAVNSVYNCCYQKKGCYRSELHVYDTLEETELWKFVTAGPPTSKRNFRVFAIDCEMVYTDKGPALARLTVVDARKKLIMDVKIKPPGKVLCANTKFSGLTMKDVEEATETLDGARTRLLRLINKDTILIGHSLENDFKALRLIHKNVIDTAVLFGREMKSKKALRFLSKHYLGKSIQQDAGRNHDSFEDAATCIELLMYKLKTEKH